MNLIQLPLIQSAVRMAHEGYTRGWHERNGGNLSYRLRPEEVEEARAGFAPRGWEKIGVQVPSLAGEHFLVTGTGRYMGNVLTATEETIGIIELDGAGWYGAWPGRGARPASFPPT